MPRRRSRLRLRPLLVVLGLALAATPLLWPEGDGPVDRAVAEIVAAVQRVR